MSKRNFDNSLPLEAISAWIYSRKQIDTERLKETQDNIKEKGIIQPIIVRRTKNGYEGIAGKLRYDSATALGLKQIPAIVYEKLEDIDATDILLIENLHRQELSDLDEANILNLYVKRGYTQEQIGTRINKSKSYVSFKLKILEDTAPIREALSSGELTEQKARLIRNLPNEKLQTQAIKQVIKEDMPVRQTKELVNDILSTHKIDDLKAQLKDKKEQLGKISEYETERDKLQKDVDKLKGEDKALKTDNVEINRKIKEIMEIENRYNPKLEEIQTLKSRISVIETERPKQPKAFIAELTKERKELTEKSAKVKSQIDGLAEQLKNLRATHNTIKEQESICNQKIRAIESTEAELKNATERIEKLTNEIQDIEKKHKSVIENFDAEKLSVEQHTKDILDRKQKLHNGIAELMQRKIKLNGHIANRGKYETAIAILEKQIKSLSKNN